MVSWLDWLYGPLGPFLYSTHSEKKRCAIIRINYSFLHKHNAQNATHRCSEIFQCLVMGQSLGKFSIKSEDFLSLKQPH